MDLLFPLIDNRTKDDVYNQLIELLKSYVPDCDLEADDVGNMLALLFSEMFSETIDRYNNIPYKNLIYFLNLLGASPKSCLSAKGFVTAKLNAGTENGVLVKKNTSVYAHDLQGERVIFELLDDLLLVDNEILSLYQKSFLENKIIKCYDSLINKNESFTIFDFEKGENLQKFRFYLGNFSVFYNKGDMVIEILVVNKVNPFTEELTAKKLADDSVFVWKFLSAEGWLPITKVDVVGSSLHLFLQDEIPSMFLFDEPSHWLSCTLIDNKKYDEITFSTLMLSSKGANILPDKLYFNDTELEKHQGLPFGSSYCLYDDFYIKCDSVFTKAGAVVNLTFDFDVLQTKLDDKEVEHPTKWKNFLHKRDVATPEVEDIYVSNVLWEYWNGQGWARLFENRDYEEIFKFSEKCVCEMRFICPEDIDILFVGADMGFFIRARITAINNLFQLKGSYVAPVLNSLNISYQYFENLSYPDYFYVEKNMEFISYPPKNDDEIVFYEKNEEEPCLYIALKNKLPKGVIKLQFNMKNDFFDVEVPKLKWEYFGMVNGAPSWKGLTISDGTFDFKKSGIVTFVSQGDFVEKNIFLEERFWIRIVNMDCKYENKDVVFPQINSVLFNTVPIIQREKMNVEHYFIDPGEINKRCYVNSKNIISLDVWVDETYLKNDLHNISDLEIRKECNDDGEILEIWVKWTPVSSLDKYSELDRVYVFVPEKSYIYFGDAVNGKIPQSLVKETIQIEYSVSAGERGNFEPAKILGFTTAVPFIDKVSNFDYIAGGCNSETMENAISRSLHIVKHQNSIVSEEDFFEIARHADSNIAQVKVLSIDGKIEVAVLPKNMHLNKNFFEEIKKNLEKEFIAKAPVVLTLSENIKILEACYIKYCVHLEVVTEDYNDYHYVYNEIEHNLKKFFHPINGNFHQKGFVMGELPTKMQIYNYIKNIDRLVEIKNIYIICYECCADYEKEIDYSEIFEFDYGVPIDGEHVIEIIPKAL